MRNLADRDLLLKLISFVEGKIGFFVKISKLGCLFGSSGNGEGFLGSAIYKYNFTFADSNNGINQVYYFTR